MDGRPRSYLPLHLSGPPEPCPPYRVAWPWHFSPPTIHGSAAEVEEKLVRSALEWVHQSCGSSSSGSDSSKQIKDQSQSAVSTAVDAPGGPSVPELSSSASASASSSATAVAHLSASACHLRPFHAALHDVLMSSLPSFPSDLCRLVASYSLNLHLPLFIAPRVGANYYDSTPFDTLIGIATVSGRGRGREEEKNENEQQHQQQQQQQQGNLTDNTSGSSAGSAVQSEAASAAWGTNIDSSDSGSVGGSSSSSSSPTHDTPAATFMDRIIKRYRVARPRPRPRHQPSNTNSQNYTNAHGNTSANAGDNPFGVDEQRFCVMILPLLFAGWRVRQIIGWSGRRHHWNAATYVVGVQLVWGPPNLNLLPTNAAVEQEQEQSLDLEGRPGFVTSKRAVGRHDAPHSRTFMTLYEDEYVRRIDFRCGQYCDSIAFQTNMGRSFRVGTSRGGNNHVMEAPEGCALVALHGAIGGHIHNLGALYMSTIQTAKPDVKRWNKRGKFVQKKEEGDDEKQEEKQGEEKASN